MTQNETWLPIKGFEDRYSVSNLGSIKNITTGKTLKPFEQSPGGYLKVKLSRNSKATNKFVHRCVLEAFKDNPNNLPTCEHENGRKQDNNIRNLSWASYKDQQDNIKWRRFFAFEEPEPPKPKLTQVDIFMRLYFSN